MALSSVIIADVRHGCWQHQDLAEPPGAFLRYGLTRDVGSLGIRSGPFSLEGYHCTLMHQTKCDPIITEREQIMLSSVYRIYSPIPKLMRSLVFVLGIQPMTLADPLPAISDRPPVPTPHFPNATYAVVWRNWQLV